MKIAYSQFIECFDINFQRFFSSGDDMKWNQMHTPEFYQG